MAASELVEQSSPNINIPEQTLPYGLPNEYTRVGSLDGLENSYTDAEIANNRKWALRGVAALGIVIASGAAGFLGTSRYGTEVQVGTATCRAYTDFSGYGKINVYNSGDSTQKLALLAEPIIALDGNVGADVECPDKDLPFTITKDGLQLRKGVKDWKTALAPFEDPKEYVKSAEENIKLQQLIFTGEALVLLSGMAMAAQLMREKDSSESKLPARAMRLALVTALLCTAATSGKSYASDQLASPPGERVSSVYPDFPMQDLRVGGVVLQYLKSITKYFDEAKDELAHDAKRGGLLLPNKNTFNVSFNGGQHCQTLGMDFTGALNNTFKVSEDLDGGDLVMTGSSSEKYCLSRYMDAMGSTPTAMAPGDHESVVSERQAQEIGFHILNNHLIKVGGLWVIGNSSPRFAQDGKTSYRRDQTESEMGTAVGQASCLSVHEPVVLNNEPHATRAALQYQCASLGLAIARHGYYEVVNGIPYITAGGAGGVVPNAITLGDIRSKEYPAEDVIIQFSKPTKESGPVPLAFQRVYLFPGPHNKVRFSHIEFMPGAYTPTGELALAT